MIGCAPGPVSSLCRSMEVLTQAMSRGNNKDSWFPAASLLLQGDASLEGLSLTAGGRDGSELASTMG